jgi:hypothetical protein
MTNTTNAYGLTDDEMQALLEATPEQIATAAAEVARDPNFWVDLLRAFLEGFIRGLNRA